MNVNQKIETVCYHCGVATKNPLIHEEKHFCCQGCKSVFQILEQNNLCQYYDLTDTPGRTIDFESGHHKFAFLKDSDILKKIQVFEDDLHIHLIFYLPQVHCSSCLYLLENFHKIHEGVSAAKLNFSKKELLVVYEKSKTTAFDIALSLSQLGYEPYFSLSDIDATKVSPKWNKSRVYRLGVAGFAFGNIMLLSFPEYFAYGTDLDGLKPYFQWIIITLIIPVITYSSMEFYRLAWGGIKERYVNIDLPIVLAMLMTFGRSIYEIATQTGPGYFDSLSGIVFFMLAGRLLQDHTHKTLTFNRDFSHYFPISTTVFKKGKEVCVPLPEVNVHDELIIHSQELIPVDGILASGKAVIDYSFVTGESQPVTLDAGSFLYAGGRQMGSSIRILAQKTMSQGYLVSLWNRAQSKQESTSQIESKYVQKASMYFTFVVFSIAIAAAIFWSFQDPSKVWNAVTAVLIVACPCALLLSVTFTHGHFLSLFAKNGFYAKSAKVLERLNAIDMVVFDKTGTLTDAQNPHIAFKGASLSRDQKDAIFSLAKESVHPYARKVSKWLQGSLMGIEGIENIPGQGILGYFDSKEIRLGNASFVGQSLITAPQGGSQIWVSWDGIILGYFEFHSALRPGLSTMMKRFPQSLDAVILSGDNASDKSMLSGIMPKGTLWMFEQHPQDKKRCIEEWERSGKRTLMMGDGLNDAGALMSAYVGVAVTEDVSYFTPGSDAILEGHNVYQLPQFLGMAKGMRQIIWWSFGISIVYNIVGLSYAVSGTLNPIVAAILMPSSSISIVLFTWLGSLFMAKKWNLKT